ncbi:MAG: hypothetical protein RL370_566, partial [Actinomycetota bacterium]
MDPYKSQSHALLYMPALLNAYVREAIAWASSA